MTGIALSTIATGTPFIDERAVAKREHEIRVHRSHILDRMPELPPWVVERRFHAYQDYVTVSDMLDRAHPDNPHVKAGNVARRGKKPAWFELVLSWDEAGELFGTEPIREIRFTAYKYIIQRKKAS